MYVCNLASERITSGGMDAPGDIIFTQAYLSGLSGR